MQNLSNLSNTGVLPPLDLSTLLDVNTVLSAYLETTDTETIEAFKSDLSDFIFNEGENPFLQADIQPLAPNLEQWETIKAFLARKSLFNRDISFRFLKGCKIQSVGKLDRNEKSIFEGDIIREYQDSEFSDFLIYYDVSECAFMAYLLDSEDYGSYHLLSFDESEIEIMGHFLTNKNLLQDFNVSMLEDAKKAVEERGKPRQARF